MSDKDPNYAVKVEQAIAKKYGKETVVNPKSQWDDEKEKKYLDELKEVYYTNVDKEDLDKQEGGSLSIADAKSRGLNPKTGDWKKHGRWIKKPDDDKEERVKSLTQPKSPISQELKKYKD